MLCPRCGSKNNNGARFCAYCGFQLTPLADFGKEKCEYLKSVRNGIAKNNNIPYVSAPCTNTDPCEGTCPACEAETAALREMLKARRTEGNCLYLGGFDAEEALKMTSDDIRNMCTPKTDMVMGLMQGPVYETPGIPAEPIQPKRESFLRKIKKAFGK
jgi:hypothetical protein